MLLHFIFFFLHHYITHKTQSLFDLSFARPITPLSQLMMMMAMRLSFFPESMKWLQATSPQRQQWNQTVQKKLLRPTPFVQQICSFIVNESLYKMVENVECQWPTGGVLQYNLLTSSMSFASRAQPTKKNTATKNPVLNELHQYHNSSNKDEKIPTNGPGLFLFLSYLQWPEQPCLQWRHFLRSRVV